MRHQAFRDRAEAGRVLAASLTSHTNVAGGIVLALPRGGVPVAFEVAKALHLPLDVFLVRKLGVPGHEELAMGAIASGDVRVVNDDVMEMLGLTENALERVATRESAEIERRERLYRGSTAARSGWARCNPDRRRPGDGRDDESSRAGDTCPEAIAPDDCGAGGREERVRRHAERGRRSCLRHRARQLSGRRAVVRGFQGDE